MRGDSRSVRGFCLLWLAVLLLFAAVAGAGNEGNTFHVRTYGNFRTIVATQDLDGVVGLEQALTGQHLYAVGEIKNAEGEITVVNGELFLNYGEDGIDTSLKEIPKGEEAMQLITACVGRWHDVAIPKTMSDNEFLPFLIEEAKKSGLDTKRPFPFLIEGEFKDLVWHVLRDSDIGRDRQLFFTKLIEYREEAAAVVVGFCSEGPAEFVNPGESWHAHVLFRNDRTAGHIDAFSVMKGEKLRLPVK
jgi:hypothetical protein